MRFVHKNSDEKYILTMSTAIFVNWIVLVNNEYMNSGEQNKKYNNL